MSDWPGFAHPSVRLAEAYAACGAWSEARNVLAESDARDEDSVAASFLLGHHAGRERDWELAFHHWGSASRQIESFQGSRHPGRESLRSAIISNLGVAHAMLGDLRSAHDCWVLVLAGEHPRPETMTGLGLAHHLLGRPHEARQTLEMALRHTPSWAPALVNFGISMAIGGALEEAEHCFVRAVAVLDSRAEPRRNLAMLYRIKGQEAEATACWNRSMRDPDGPWLDLEGWTGMLPLVEHPGRPHRPFHDPVEGPVVYVLDDDTPAEIDGG